MKWLFIFLMLAVGSGFAQSRPGRKTAAPAAAEPQARWPIAGLVVEGNRVYTPQQILAAAGLKIGQLAGKPDFESARMRLLASGAFESVGYRFEPAGQGRGYKATFQVVEAEPVYPLRCEDLHVSQREIEELLRSKDPLFSPEKVPPTQPVIERYGKWIHDYLASKGNEDKIAGGVRPLAEGGYAVVFHPERNLPAVAEIRFEGARVIPENVLREAIAGTGIGSEYTEDRFRELLNHALRPLYEARGRVRASFPNLRTEQAEDVKGLRVLVTVDEGESYTLGKVAIDGPTPLPAPDLLKAGDFKTGEVVNFDRVGEGMERIRKALRRAGYMEARITPSRTIDDGKRAVDLALYVSPGPRYTMGKLTLAGLDLDGEAEINRIWTMKPGKPFNADYPEMFLNRIREQGLFDNLGKTKSDIKIDEKSRTADVTLTFGGSAPQQRKPRPPL